MKNYLYLLLAICFIGTSAFAESIGCSNFPGNVQFADDGSLVGVTKEGLKKIPVTNTSGNTVTYKASQGTAFWKLENYQYKVTLVDGKPAIMDIASETSFGPLVGMGADQYNNIEYDLEYTKAGKCFIKTGKNKDSKSIFYDASLCQNLLEKFNKIATPSEINKCSAILDQMAAAIKDYTSKTGWAVEPKANSPFQKSMMFASNCKKALGLDETEQANSTKDGKAVR